MPNTKAGLFHSHVSGSLGRIFSTIAVNEVDRRTNARLCCYTNSAAIDVNVDAPAVAYVSKFSEEIYLYSSLLTFEEKLTPSKLHNLQHPGRRDNTPANISLKIQAHQTPYKPSNIPAMSASAVTPSIAFFGATGGCANACLVHSLRGGHKCVALVRTPEKLRKQLTHQGVSESVITSQLLITQGNATEVADVKKTLTAGGSSSLVSTIVTGLGGAPHLQFDWKNPLQIAALDQPTICEDAAKAVVAALNSIYTEQPALKTNKPTVVFVATTGITRGPEDVPFVMRFLYHQMLAVPHKDKKKMEDIFRGNVEKGGDEQVFRCVTGMRPTLLGGAVDVNDKQGVETVRAGTEQKPALGYSIKRADVGEWMFKNLIHEAEAKKTWEGEMVTLTH